jgi:hypothetical protein
VPSVVLVLLLTIAIPFFIMTTMTTTTTTTTTTAATTTTTTRRLLVPFLLFLLGQSCRSVQAEERAVRTEPLLHPPVPSSYTATEEEEAQHLPDEAVSPFLIVRTERPPIRMSGPDGGRPSSCFVFRDYDTAAWLTPVLLCIVLFVGVSYVQILDGGSTGSRLHIFEFYPADSSTLDTNNNDDTVDEATTASADATTATAAETLLVRRRGTARADQPLSAFVGASPTAVADHLMPTFVYAAQQIPRAYHKATRVLYQATAGMRLLTDDQQASVYNAMYEGLHAHPLFDFSLARADVSTLSGDLEGYYGALAANYLHGSLTASLEWQASNIVGALDMGGSSTQLVFLPHAHNDDADDATTEEPPACRVTTEEDPVWTDATTTATMDDCHVANRDEYPSGEDFFAVSYLSYGADQFRERLWTTWVQEAQQQAADENTCQVKTLENPCAFRGHEATWMGYTLVGTGQAHECVTQVQRHIPHPEDTVEKTLEKAAVGTQVGGIAHPPVHGRKFVAMSLYFFTLDALRSLSHPDPEAYEALNLSWPNPSINELFDALDGLCSRQWEGDLSEIAHDAHAFTKPHVLPHRCLEAVYIVTLLRDGFGFAPESRDITFTFLVDGSEVEWTLGMALALKAEEGEPPSRDDVSSKETVDQDDAESERRSHSSTTNNTFDGPSSSATQSESCTLAREFSQVLAATSS